MLRHRDSHKAEVLVFLRQNFPGRDWEITLPPHGTGHESYFARGGEQVCFVKLGVQIERYQVMFALGLSPRLLATSFLADGTPLVLQEKINGRKPSHQDFQHYLDQFARCIHSTHHCEGLKHILHPKSSGLYKDAGLETLTLIERCWETYRPQVPTCAVFVDESLAYLREQINQFCGGGLVASHNDICNANWLVSTNERVYLIDYESMSLDDPALDLGAILWWYYPPHLRNEFLAIAGYGNDPGISNRMRIRMAIHCLHILLPRENSFDRFEAGSFEAALVDFRAVLAGKENPQGYND